MVQKREAEIKERKAGLGFSLTFPTDNCRDLSNEYL